MMEIELALAEKSTLEYSGEFTFAIEFTLEYSSAINFQKI